MVPSSAQPVSYGEIRKASKLLGEPGSMQSEVCIALGTAGRNDSSDQIFLRFSKG